MLVKAFGDVLRDVEEAILAPILNIGSMGRTFENEALLAFVLLLREIEA